MDASSDQDLLTTGQVAKMLGTSIQHVVNLCTRGELRYTMAGTHRRIRREDVLVLAERAAANKGGPMTTDQIRSLWLHRAAAAKVARDPEGSLLAARKSIDRLLLRKPHGARWLRQWLIIIGRGPEAVMRTMTSTDPLARELRQNSPFLSLLSARERQAVIEAFQKTPDREAKR
jgi:excisionase family DNA binding protein